eukprot:g2900.t1
MARPKNEDYDVSANHADMILDVVNIGFDFARRAVRKGLEALGSSIRRKVKEDLRAQTHSRGILESGLQPNLRTRELSFFDDYDVKCGVPVFTLDLSSVEQYQNKAPRLERRFHTLRNTKEPNLIHNSYQNLNQRPSLTRRGVELTENKISCHTFSPDDQILVCGARNGTLFVWDASNGKILHVLSGQHDSPVADVAFRTDSPRTIVSVDLSGVCVCWDLNQKKVSIKSMSCSPEFRDEQLLGTEGAVPCLSEDGRYVAHPVFLYSESDTITGDNELSRSAARLLGDSESRISDTRKHAMLPRFFANVYVFEVKRTAMFLQTTPLFTLPVVITERWTGAECMLDLVQFSRTSSGLLFTVYELSKGYLVFWPRLKDMDITSYKLEGTKGRFNADDSRLVTWRAVLSSSEGTEDHCCYVWNLNNLAVWETRSSSSSWEHPRGEAHNSLVFKDPNHGSVLACDFVVVHESEGLAVFSITDSLQVIVWSLVTEIPVHILHTKLKRGDVIPGSYVNVSEETTRMERTCGVKCCAVSNDGQCIGVYSSVAKKGYVWNSSLGVEVFQINEPAGVSEAHRYVDFYFSQTTSSLALIGKSRIFLWDAVVLQNFNEVEKPIHSLTGSQADLCGGIVNCQFSQCGNAIGLLPAYALSLDIWKLNPQKQYRLNRQKVTQEFATDANRRRLERSGDVGEGKYRFCKFAIGTDIHTVVTSMGDMSVLLWDVRDVTRCRRIAVLSSEYLPALDICFSQDLRGNKTIVVCQDQGVLVWIELAKEVVVHRTCKKRIRTCRFSTDGKTAVLVLDLFRVEVINLIERTVETELTYPIPLFNQQAFPPMLSPDGRNCLIGFDTANEPVICYPGSSIDTLERVTCAPQYAALSHDGEWLIMYGNICSETDSFLMDRDVTLDTGSSEHIEGFPTAKYTRSITNINTLHVTRNVSSDVAMETKKGWKLIHLRGKFKTKEIRMPFEMLPEKFIAISADGRRCAALSTSHKLMVFSPEYTYKTIIHTREKFTNIIADKVRGVSDCGEFCDEYGPALLNHAYKNGMTPVMECVQYKNKAILSQLLHWALENDVKLALRSNINIPNTHIYFENILDFSVYMKVPDMAKMISSAMLEGVTTLTEICQIFEDALISLSSIYPALAIDLWKNKHALTPLCTVYVSEGFFKEQASNMAVLTDKCNVASKDYIQGLWAGQEKATMKNLTSLYKILIAADARMFPYPNAAKLGSEGVLQSLLLEDTDHQIFGSEPVKGVINYKYETYGRSLILEDMYHYILLLILYTTLCIYLGYSYNSNPKLPSGISIANISALVALGFLIRFLKQLNALWHDRGFQGLLYYLTDIWKWFEISSYILVVLVIPITINERSVQSELLDGILAIASVLLWTKFLYYAQAFKSTGPMVVMIKEIAKDIKWFLFLLFIMLLGFGVAFFILMSGNKSNADNSETDGTRREPDRESESLIFECLLNVVCLVHWQFDAPWTSTLTMFLLMLSDVSEIVDVIVRNQGLRNETKTLAVFFIVIFLAAVAIILLNLMIAIMGDSFNRVKTHEQTQFLKRRAQVIQDMEMGLSGHKKHRFNANIAPYLHVLTPKYQTNFEAKHQEGRILDLHRKMGEELSAIKEVETNDFLELKTEMAHIKRLLLRVLNEQKSSSGSHTTLSEFSGRATSSDR